MNHFEDLWVEAENLSKETDKNKIIELLIQELNNYKSLQNEATRVRKLGEILFSLCNLSLVDNIDVYNALLLSIKLNEI